MTARLVAFGLIVALVPSGTVASAQAPAGTQAPAATKAPEPSKKVEDLDKRLTAVEEKIKATDGSKDGDACCCPDADKKCCDACCCQGATKSNEHLEAIALNTKSSWLALYIVLVLAVIGIAAGWLSLRRREDKLESFASQVKAMTDDVKAMTGDVRTMADEVKGLVAATTAPSPRPVVNRMIPQEARIREHIVIRGAHFSQNALVKFDDAVVSPGDIAENFLVVQVPTVPQVSTGSPRSVRVAVLDRGAEVQAGSLVVNA